MLLVSTFTDPDWFHPTIARAVPKGDDDYGGLRVLEGTAWWDTFARVHPDLWDAAARGHAGPLMRALGSPPKGRAAKLPGDLSLCAQREACVIRGPGCTLRGIGGKAPPPRCFEPDGLSPEQREAARAIVQCWIGGIPVVVLTTEGLNGR